MMICHHALKRTCRYIFASLLFIFAANIQAAGFALIEQSVSSMGTAYAGASAIAEDTSTIYFNPASMSRLEGSQLSNGVHIILPNTSFSGTGSLNPPFGTGDGDEISGGNGGNAGTTGVVPHFSYSQKVNDKVTAGITVNAPFGLKTEYDDDWVGRYSAIESEIITLNINPAFSYQVNDRVSVGFGISAMYAKLKLENVIDFGLLGGGAGATGLADGSANLDVDDWGFGYNFGFLFEPTAGTRFGFAYRSEVDVELDGDVDIDGPALSQNAEVSTDLPASASLSAYHEVNSKWAVLGDITWTQWSNQDALVAQFDDGSSNTIPLDWQNTMRVAIGASYKYSNNLTLRSGVAFDESPIPSAELRLASLPDDDRIWLTFGAGYKHSDKLSFDFGYAHLFVDDPRIESDDAISTAQGGVPFHHISGQYDADVDIISAQLNYKFK